MIYADPSFLVAARERLEANCQRAVAYYEAAQNEAWLWSPLHRVEVFNTIRQLVRHPEKARRLLPTEARR